MAARGSRSALPGRALAGGVRRSFRDSTSGVVASHGRCGSPEPRPHSCGAPTCRGPEARSLPPREGLGATSGSARASRPRGRPMSVLTRGFDRWSSSPRRGAPSWALRPWVSSPGRLHRLFSISTPYEGTSDRVCWLLIRRLLEREVDQVERSKYLRSAIEATDGLYLPLI